MASTVERSEGHCLPGDAGRNSALAFLLCILMLAAGCTRGAKSSTADTASTPPPWAKELVGLRTQPYEAGALTPDAQRVFDIMGLQASLLQFQLANKLYPASLGALYPAYATPGPGGAPTAGPPTDPVTHEAYTYAVVNGGDDYAIAAILSNGRQFAGFPRPAR